MLAKGPEIVDFVTPLKVRHIPIETPPPPEPPEPQPQPRTEVRPQTQVTQVQPRIRVERPVQPTFDHVPDLPVTLDPGPVGNVIAEPVPQPLPQPTPQPKADPVRRGAQMLASSALQPSYPASEERAQNEGSVTIRILIGTDGRVKAVTRIKAASDAFFRATESQALRHWRFKPATVDGKPVESTKVMTVHFRLNA